MTLRRKLLGAFLALASIALLVAGVALFVTLTWQQTTAQIERHYQRSLLLQRIRAGTFQALKEVDDALTGDHVDAADDFERALQPTSRDFAEWAALADTPHERAEVIRVRATHERLIGHARQVFELVPRNRAAAIRLVDDEIDTRAYEQFRLQTEQGVEADRNLRLAITAETDRVRATTQVMLAISAFSILSLVLLLAAFLSQDLFRPLRELAGTLERLHKGDAKARAEEGRDDEIGAVARSLNRYAGAVGRGAHAGPAGIEVDGRRGQPLRRLLNAIEANMARLSAHGDAEVQAVAAQARELARSAASLGALEAPPTLDLETVELAALIHKVIACFRTDLVRRGVSLEVSLGAEPQTILADRLKLRSALEEIVQDALGRLAERGGRLGFRTRDDPDEPGFVRVEVAHDSLDAREFSAPIPPAEAADNPAEAKLAAARVVADAHGGTVSILGEPGQARVVRLRLPRRP